MEKLTIQEYIEKLSVVAVELSLKYAEKLIEGDEDKDELKHLNEIKKNLNFAKRLYKEINPQSANSKGSSLDNDFFKKIKELESSVGDIVRSMPKK